MLSSCGVTDSVTDPSRVETGPISIANLVAWAYQVSPKEVDGPGWMRDAWFEVVATFPNGAGGKAPEMLRHLLADRFKLVAHVDKRTESVFALTAPNGDGKKPKAPKAVKKAAPVKKAAAPKKGGSQKQKYMGTLEKETISAGLMSLPDDVSGIVLDMIKADQPAVDVRPPLPKMFVTL